MKGLASHLHLTRRQVQILSLLKKDGFVFTEGMHRTTVEALLDADLAYETDAGHLHVSEVGRRAAVVGGWLLPEARSARKVGVGE